jgi:hypothetical protein
MRADGSRTNLIVSALAIGAWLLLADAHAGEVIAHPSVQLTADEIRDVFLGEKRFAANIRLVPVDNSTLRAEFVSQVLQTDERTYTMRWTRLAKHQGAKPPAVLSSDKDVCSFVRSTPGAIGYVSQRTSGTTVLHDF